MAEKILAENVSERSYRWPDLEIAAGDTVEIYKEQMERIPVIKKLLKAGELIEVGASNSPEPKKAQEKPNDDEEEDVSEIVEKLKKTGKKK